MARAIAFYLPQFHRTAENDRWWGAGFTEWTNVRSAKPLFAGHEQPVVPGELGYYDLRSARTRAAQAELAEEHGIEGFCYWHYWFAGDRLLHEPFDGVLESGEPRLPFCLAWANHSWTASWVGREYEVLKTQTYPGRSDVEAHFRFLRKAFEDERYITVDGKPLFIIFRPKKIPNLDAIIEPLRELAAQHGFPGLHLLGILDRNSNAAELGLDGSIDTSVGQLVDNLHPWEARKQVIRRRFARAIARPSLSALHQTIAHLDRPPVLKEPFDRTMLEFQLPLACEYQEVVQRAIEIEGSLPPNRFPCAVPNWDNTPRVGRWGLVLRNSTPERYGQHLRHVIKKVMDRPREHRLVFLKSWNEWAEGNYLEPDAKHGRAYLETTRDVLMGSLPTNTTGRAAAGPERRS